MGAAKAIKTKASLWDRLFQRRASIPGRGGLGRAAAPGGLTAFSEASRARLDDVAVEMRRLAALVSDLPMENPHVDPHVIAVRATSDNMKSKYFKFDLTT
ncbi:hypothetical protein StoSoilB3_03970 [Arthrobacter sp. StoSoilB3]|nr:hypothetical protein StoSoilB3_03970 [Arthrobacter sp. StoSoilB3]